MRVAADKRLTGAALYRQIKSNQVCPAVRSVNNVAAWSMANFSAIAMLTN